MPRGFGGGLEHPAFGGRLAGTAGEAAFRPRFAEPQAMAAARQCRARRLGEARFECHEAGVRGARIERTPHVLGVKGGEIDRLLQVHAVMHVMQEHQLRPLVLVDAARRAEGEIGFPRAESDAEFRNDRRALQPAAARRRRDHVAPAVDDIDMAGVADSASCANGTCADGVRRSVASLRASRSDLDEDPAFS